MTGLEEEAEPFKLNHYTCMAGLEEVRERKQDYLNPTNASDTGNRFPTVEDQHLAK